MLRSPEKSQFLCRNKDIWDRLTKETRRSDALATQLAAAYQGVAELSPTTRELADLQVREMNACEDAHEADEKITALIKRMHAYAVESERLWKERDDLFWAIEGLRMECTLAHQERTDAQ